jgi:hypothetical protein
MGAGGSDSAQSIPEAGAEEASTTPDGGEVITVPGDATSTGEAASDSSGEGGPTSCPMQLSATAPAGTAVSAGFAGTDSDYFMLLTDAKCTTAADCATACEKAGGTSASCQADSSCIAAGSGRKSCVPPDYWFKVSQALSESGMTSNSAAIDLVASKYDDALILTNFKLAVADGATITGIQFKVHHSANSGMAVDGSVKVLKAGAPVGTDHSQATAWPIDLDHATYGDASDTWGTTWTPADVRAQGFGVAIAPRYKGDPGGTDRAHIDSVRVTVFYTMPCQ